MYKLVLIRHGESTWNKENRFTGWHDVDLTDTGVAQAQNAGQLLKENGFSFDLAFTSVLTRAMRTLWIALDKMNELYTPVVRHWRLNERHYGALQGLNKAETAAEHGDEQVKIWRRSFDVPPPPMEKDHPYYDNIRNDPRYKDGPSDAEFPKCESLKLTIGMLCVFLNYFIFNCNVSLSTV